jgi:hypothetical protein
MTKRRRAEDLADALTDSVYQYIAEICADDPPEVVEMAMSMTGRALLQPSRRD